MTEPIELTEKFDLIKFLDECKEGIDKNQGWGIGQIFTYKGYVVDIEMVKNESWLNFDKEYVIQCIRDKLKHLDTSLPKDEYYTAHRILEELLDQVE